MQEPSPLGVDQVRERKPFLGMRILTCGKGGCGKSSFVTLLSHVLCDRGYKVVVLDGDASNPGGLARLLFGLTRGPEPLIEFFGGRERVECPVDNPEPLTRVNEASALTEKKIALSEIPPEYSVERGGIVLFQAGKIEEAYEGCDGPMSKVNRDFMVKGDSVTLIDVEAGIEHFGRGVERNVDIVIVVADPTFESFAISEKVARLCGEMGIERVYAVLSKVENAEMQSLMTKALKKTKADILGAIHSDPEVLKAGLTGSPIGTCEALKEVKRIVEQLEERLP